MGITRFPNGVSSFGVPVIGWPMPTARGSVWFVDATNGSDGNDGKTVDRAFSTVQKAVDQAVNNAGDVIYIFPGSYTENVTVTDKNYVTFIAAMANRYGRPDIVPATGVPLAITRSYGVSAWGVRFGVTGDANAVTVDSDGFIFSKCVFDGNTAQTTPRACLRVTGNAANNSYNASEGLVDDCLFRGAASAYGIVILHAAGPNGQPVTDFAIQNCRFFGNSVDVRTNANSDGGGIGIIRDLKILKNYFLDKDKATYLDLDQTSAFGGDTATDNTGIIAGNYFNSNETFNNTDIQISGTGVHAIGNYTAFGVRDASAINS